MDRRRGDRQRARRLQLTERASASARSWLLGAAACLALLLPGCFDGRLDTFEVAAGRGGQATAELGGGGSGGSAGGPAGTAGGAGQTDAAGLLLDDFEDQNNEAEPDGWWYPKEDGTGPPATMNVEAVTGRGVSRFGIHLTAGPVEGYGAFLGLDLPGGVFDATGFSSLSFFVRLEPAGDTSIRFQDPVTNQYEAIRPLGTSWQELRVPLADFRSTDDGTTPLDPSELSHLQIWLTGPHAAFDLWVDDVWLLREP